uniref:hypothetical protein n=1 Tax=Rhodosalinus sediminis TaxID=1940533 RepID=UPI0023573020
MPDHPRFPAPRYGPAERRMAEGLVELERRHLDAGAEADCPCREGMFDGLTRRGLLAGGASLGGALLGAGAA